MTNEPEPVEAAPAATSREQMVNMQSPLAACRGEWRSGEPRCKDVSARTCSAYAGDKVLQVLQNEGKHCSSPDDAPEVGTF